MKVQRTTSQNPNFIALVKKLDAYLAVTDGDEHTFYNQFNSIESLQHVLLIQIEDEYVACGAFKEYDATSVEIKRMFTLPSHRGKGLGSKVLSELENWAKEEDYQSCILETGKRQNEAVILYEKNGYDIVSNYGQYIGMENSVCFKKQL